VVLTKNLVHHRRNSYGVLIRSVQNWPPRSFFKKWKKGVEISTPYTCYPN